MWVSRTPLRVSFFGGGTDYQSYFSDMPGAVLGTTIDRYVYIQALPLAGFAEQKFRLTYRQTESVAFAKEITHPVVRVCLTHYDWDCPLNIATMSDLPGGTGLGSSSAFTVGFINLLHKMRGVALTKYDLAREAIYVEQQLLKENVGIQDQIHAAFGGLARYEFQGKDFAIHPLRIGRTRYALLKSSLLLVYTGRTRHASAVISQQESRTKSGANTGYLSTLYKMAHDAVAILEREGDDHAAMRDFGLLLDEAWQVKRRLSSAITHERIDELYAEGKVLGAWGAKLLGAGGGGFMLFLVSADRHGAFRQRFGARVCVVGIESEGSVVESMRPGTQSNDVLLAASPRL
jgi:D-glycero-alpha-D-manno-heptose-7-phosphate kinase